MNKSRGIRTLHQSVEADRGGYSKYIFELEKKIEEKNNSLDGESGIFFSDRPKKVNLEYVEELRKQIEFRQQMKIRERAESQRPAISVSFHGYPNLPQTPMDIRRQREVMRMKQIRENLTEQLEMKKLSLENMKNSEIESAKLRNNLDNQLMISEKEAKIQKREIEKEALVNSWGQAIRAKELKKLLDNAERKGISVKVPRTEKRSDDERPSKTMEDEANQFNFEAEFATLKKVETTKEILATPSPMIDDPVKNSQIVEKARKMKEFWDKKEKESYQFKIKQMITEAKKLRNIKKSQNSPSKLKSYK